MGSLQVTLILTPEGQRMPLYRVNNIVRGLPLGNTTNRKLMATTVLQQCDGCQPCSALLAPLFFSNPIPINAIRQGSQSGALLEDLAALMPLDASNSPLCALLHFQQRKGARKQCEN